MKTLKRFSIAVLSTGIFCIMLSSCESRTYCATCVELNASYYATDYCGTSSSVDAYIDELESYDPLYPDQNWSCSKSLD